MENTNTKYNSSTMELSGRVFLAVDGEIVLVYDPATKAIIPATGGVTIRELETSVKCSVPLEQWRTKGVESAKKAKKGLGSILQKVGNRLAE